MTCKYTISAYDFFRLYPDEKAAIAYLEKRRWYEGIGCPLCGSERTSRQRDYRYHQCKECRGKCTVRRYVDEFCFRLNESDVKRHTLERIDNLVDQAIGKRLMYQELVS